MANFQAIYLIYDGTVTQPVHHFRIFVLPVTINLSIFAHIFVKTFANLRADIKHFM